MPTPGSLITAEDGQYCVLKSISVQDLLADEDSRSVGLWLTINGWHHLALLHDLDVNANYWYFMKELDDGTYSVMVRNDNPTDPECSPMPIKKVASGRVMDSL